MENEPEARPKAMPMTAMNRVTAIEVRNRPCSLPMSKKVKGYVMEPLGSHRFDKVDIEE